MTLAEYIATLRRSWVIVVALLLVGATLGYGYAAVSTPTYRAETSALVTTDLGGSASDLVQGSTYAENLVASYVRLVTSERVLQPVIDDQGLGVSLQQLTRSVSAEAPLNTLVIDIAVVDADPRRAASTADAVTESLSDTVREVSPQVEGEPAVRLTIVESASVPLLPISPRTKLLVAAGALVGLLLGVGLAVVRFLLGAAVRTAADVARVTDAPVLGQVVEARRDTRLSAVVIENPMGPEAESVRGLVANLDFVQAPGGLRSIVVTSSSPAEAKSSVATALALVLTEASRRVLLVDADLRAPTLHTVSNLDNSLGLSTVLIGEDSLAVAAQAWGRHGGLDVLTSGPLPPNPGQLLRSEAMVELVRHAEELYDYVVIDTPPVGSVVDPVWIGQQVSGVILVARRGKAKPRALLHALDTLATGNVTVLGIVLSRMPRPSRSDYGYGYGYGRVPSTRRRWLPVLRRRLR